MMVLVLRASRGLCLPPWTRQAEQVGNTAGEVLTVRQKEAQHLRAKRGLWDDAP